MSDRIEPAKTLRDGIERNVPFREGRSNLTGSPYWLTDAGELPEPYRTEFRNSGADYVIRSYDTPIAWRRPDGTWRIPPVTYSVTTSNHQRGVEYALTGADRSGERISVMARRSQAGQSDSPHSPFGPRTGGF